jgi:hypothetical protein
MSRSFRIFIIDMNDRETDISVDVRNTWNVDLDFTRLYIPLSKILSCKEKKLYPSLRGQPCGKVTDLGSKTQSSMIQV